MNLCTEELVGITTEDGVYLSGAVFRPVAKAAKPLTVVWNHGFTGHYDEKFVIAVGRQVAARGFTFVAGNNRGHHFGALLERRNGEQALGGGWWEKIEESPYDIGAWITFGAGLGSGEIVLAGHSLGTIKVLLYQTQRQDPRVTAMILGSPPVPIRSWLEKWDPELRAQAARLVAEGRGEDLMPSPLGLSMSAQTFHSWNDQIPDVFGTQSGESAIARIRCPLLVCFGTNEANIVSAEDVELLRRNAVRVPRFESRVIEGGDHVYTDHEDEAGVAVAGWLESLA